MGKVKASQMAPTQQVPQARSASYGGGPGAMARPIELRRGQMAIASARAGAAPTLTPPSSAAHAGTNIATTPGTRATARAGTVWQDSQHVNALWSINQNRNSWVGIDGIGWLKLADNSDTAVISLTTLASFARQYQWAFTYRQEDDGMIHEVYAW